jgi:hypothetical protein
MAAEEPQEEACRSGKKRLEAQQRLVKFYNEWWARSGADVRGQLDQAMHNVQATVARQAENCGDPRAASEPNNNRRNRRF